MSNEIDDVFSNEFEDTLKRTVKKSRKKIKFKNYSYNLYFYSTHYLFR